MEGFIAGKKDVMKKRVTKGAGILAVRLGIVVLCSWEKCGDVAYAARVD
jgi:hypothetical protein